jgi:DNA mismatch repair protein MutS
MSDSTPLMSQYRDIKSKHQDSILLFRVGDFYETFYEDAVEVSSILSIALTTRDKNKPNPIPLAGVPFHAAETYISRLLAAGRKVAVCEQVEDPAQAKGLVRRDVVEVLTPGTAMNTQLLQERENNYCLCVHSEGTTMAVALIDVSTGDFLCGDAESDAIHHLVQGKRVRELVCAAGADRERLRPLIEAVGNPVVVEAPGDDFTAEGARGALATQFGDASPSPSLSDAETVAAGALLQHCFRLRNASAASDDEAMPQVVGVEALDGIEFLTLDDETIANLELFEPLRGGVAKATLVDTVDRTLTPMGARELRRWMQKPLCSTAPIDERLDAVGRLHSDAGLSEEITRGLKGVADIQRLCARIAARKAIPREFHALRESLEKVPELRRVLADAGSAMLERAVIDMGEHDTLCATIDRAIEPDPPGHLREGGVIRRGFDAELDALIAETDGARQWIAALEARERDATGMPLKVGYNKVFGYYLEVSKAHEEKVPAHYVQKQTLKSAQRYYTPELKEKEDVILHAEERRVAREQQIFEALCGRVAGEASTLQRAAAAIARVDALQSLASAARLHGYRRPIVDDSRVIEISGGRHPVLERFTDEAFVPNDLSLDPERRQFGLITGPNMSGKSTFLRQTALIVLLAQMGSFVPADKARIGLVDRIFTRVGASDRLSRGESTFLVEMNETAHILEHMTDRSLVILDEIGRGTSTYDGLSIAWAVTEYLLQGVAARPRALFATHFHELTQLRSTYPRLINLKITIREWEGGIIFLRKIVPGTSERSFGIHAARIAGLPAPVLKRAEEILQSLELRRNLLSQGVDISVSGDQLGLFSPGRAPEPDTPDPVREALTDFDLDHSTPFEAMQLVRRLRETLD